MYIYIYRIFSFRSATFYSQRQSNFFLYIHSYILPMLKEKRLRKSSPLTHPYIYSPRGHRAKLYTYIYAIEASLWTRQIEGIRMHPNRKVGVDSFARERWNTYIYTHDTAQDKSSLYIYTRKPSAIVRSIVKRSVTLMPLMAHVRRCSRKRHHIRLRAYNTPLFTMLSDDRPRQCVSTVRWAFEFD